MNSKDIAKLLVHDLKENVHVNARITIRQLDELEDRIHGFLLKQFEEGRHIGRDHDSLVETSNGEFKYEKK